MQEFQVGQKVRIVGNSYSGYWDNGEVVTIINTYEDSDGQVYDVKVNVKDSFQQVYHENDLELIETDKKTTSIQKTKILKKKSHVWVVQNKTNKSILNTTCTRREAREWRKYYQTPTKDIKIIKIDFKNSICEARNKN